MIASSHRAAPAMKPFTIVLDDGRRFRITRSGKWFVAQCLDKRGIASQGRTFEEAVFMVMDAIREVEAFEKELFGNSRSPARTAKPARKPAGPALRRRHAKAEAMV